MRRALAAGGAAILIAGPTALAFFSGGYFDRPQLVAAVVAWALVILAVLTAQRPLPVSTAGRVSLAGLLLLCGWTALSISWAPLGGPAQDDFQRVLLYVGYFTAALALLRGAEERRWLEPVLVLGAFVVVAYGLGERLLPDLVELSRSRSSAGRLEQPLSYWNAEGAVAAIGFVLAVRVAGDPRREYGLRAAAAFCGVTLGLGTYLSFSRGALAAAGAGLLLLLALAPAGRAQLRAAVVLTVATLAASLVATGFDSIRSLELGERGASGEGLQMLLVLVVSSLGAAFAAPRRARRALPAPSLGVSRPVAVLAATVLVAVAGGVAVAVLEGKPEGTSPVLGADPERLRSIDTNRYRYWDVALEAWADQPLRGIGSGGFLVYWLRESDRVDPSGDAHSLYIETAAELGVVGLLFLAMFLGGIAVGVVSLARMRPAAAAGPAAGLVAWAVHAGLDWDWEMPAVSLLALLLAAAALAASEEVMPDRTGKEIC